MRLNTVCQEEGADQNQTMEQFSCTTCKQSLSLACFYVSPSGRRKTKCRDCLSARQREHYKKNRSAIRERQNAYYRKLRLKVLEILGGTCDCCGEKRFQFLAVDHKHGGGNIHRKAGTHLSSTSQFSMWFLANEDMWPRFRILCHNCNMALGIYGDCPHGTMPVDDIQQTLPLTSEDKRRGSRLKRHKHDLD